MNTFKVGQLIVRNVNTHGEEEAGIASIYHFVRSKLSHTMFNENQETYSNFHWTNLKYTCTFGDLNVIK